MTVEEAAAELDRSRKVVLRYIREGLLALAHGGGKGSPCWISEAEVGAFKEEHRYPSEGRPAQPTRRASAEEVEAEHKTFTALITASLTEDSPALIDAYEKAQSAVDALRTELSGDGQPIDGLRLLRIVDQLHDLVTCADRVIRDVRPFNVERQDETFLGFAVDRLRHRGLPWRSVSEQFRGADVRRLKSLQAKYLGSDLGRRHSAKVRRDNQVAP